MEVEVGWGLGRSGEARSWRENVEERVEVEGGQIEGVCAGHRVGGMG